MDVLFRGFFRFNLELGLIFVLCFFLWCVIGVILIKFVCFILVIVNFGFGCGFIYVVKVVKNFLKIKYIS